MADWELTVQLKNGAIPCGCDIGGTKPLVFDTGQVIFGWVRSYKETGDDKYKKLPRRQQTGLLKYKMKMGAGGNLPLIVLLTHIKLWLTGR